MNKEKQESFENPKMVKLNVYGSLRKGEYNFESFQSAYGPENFLYQKTKTVPGFELHSLGSYPMVIETPETPKNTLVVDEMMVSEKVYQGIKRMELGAGYYEVTMDDGAILYARKSNGHGLPKIDHGDWSKYLKERV